MGTTPRMTIFWEGAAVYHEELGMFGDVINVDDETIMVQFEDESRGLFLERELMFADTAEHMLDLCDCDELGLESECSY